MIWCGRIVGTTRRTQAVLRRTDAPPCIGACFPSGFTRIAHVWKTCTPPAERPNSTCLIVLLRLSASP